MFCWELGPFCRNATSFAGIYSLKFPLFSGDLCLINSAGWNSSERKSLKGFPALCNMEDQTQSHCTVLQRSGFDKISQNSNLLCRAKVLFDIENKKLKNVETIINGNKKKNRGNIYLYILPGHLTNELVKLNGVAFKNRTIYYRNKGFFSMGVSGIIKDNSQRVRMSKMWKNGEKIPWTPC